MPKEGENERGRMDWCEGRERWKGFGAPRSCVDYMSFVILGFSAIRDLHEIIFHTRPVGI